MRSWDAVKWQAERIAELEAECAYLRELLEIPDLTVVTLRAALRCRPSGARILYRLYEQPYATAEQLMAATADDRSDGGSEIVLKVQIHNLRRLLPKNSIVTLARTGYCLSDEGRAFVRSIIETGKAQWIGPPTATSATSSSTS